MNIRTVLGDVPAEKMGVTYTHEHLLCNPVTAAKDPTLAITNAETSTLELLDFKRVGGCTFVEGTAIDYGREPEKLAKMSKETGVNIIATSGYYTYSHNPESFASASVEDIAELFVKEITVGMDGTDIKAGQIKCAVSQLFIHPNEEKALLAAALAQKITGAPIWIHHGGIMGMEILDILENAGADLSKVVLGHMDRNPDPYDYKRIAKRGSIMSLDNFARIYRYAIEENIKMLNDLLQMGCIDRLFLCCDFGRSTYMKANGGGPGLAYLYEKLVPRIKEQCSLSDEDIKKIFVDNPAKVYGQF